MSTRRNIQSNGARIGKRLKDGCIWTTRCWKVGQCYWRKCRFYKEKI